MAQCEWSTLSVRVQSEKQNHWQVYIVRDLLQGFDLTQSAKSISLYKVVVLLLMLEFQVGGAGYQEDKKVCKAEDKKDKLTPMSLSWKPWVWIGNCVGCHYLQRWGSRYPAEKLDKFHLICGRRISPFNICTLLPSLFQSFLLFNLCPLKLSHLFSKKTHFFPLELVQH